MSKIICDVCGTMYPESAAQCPICGCASQASAETEMTEVIPEENAAGSYTYVKGGRFSKKNVRKRNKEMAQEQSVSSELAEETISGNEDVQPAKKDDKAIRGLTITAIVLALAIVAMVIYIALRFFVPVDFGGSKKPAGDVPAATNAAGTVPTTEIAVEEIACTQIQMSDVSVQLNEAGQVWMIHAVALPENTTDEITFSSGDPSVVTVTSEGTLTAVAPGKTVITVTCGTVTNQCEVVCDFGSKETTEATTPETTEATTPETTTATEETADPDANYTVLFYGEWREDNDVTLATGEVVIVTLEDDNGNEADVVWKTDETDVVTIDGTTFIAESAGIAYISTTYGGVEYEIILRVY